MNSNKPKTQSIDQFVDYADGHEGHWFMRTATVVSKNTKYQKVEILELTDFGRALVLDGAVQSVEDDEYIYHEALLQPALCLHANPRRVLIIGGGEGASAREVLKHRTVEKVVMVDIDAEVVSLCREHLGAWHKGAFHDPRFELKIGDGHAYIHESSDRFDVIVIDIVDAFDGGPAEALYTTAFYRAVKARLAEGGMLVVQAMECNVNEWRHHRMVRDNLAPVFKHMRSYTTFVPSFWSTWGFILASDHIDPTVIAPEAIDRVIVERKIGNSLEFYDGQTHCGMFSLSKDVRALFGQPL